ncbi:MAG: hypothetical protein E7331_05175 [Clostridiales bacterium]|nr:hypothetical protein [Clostridiales bacterium]
MIGRSKSWTNISLYFIAACIVLLLFSLYWKNFTQPSGIVYWRAVVDPPSYEAITLQCLTNKGLVYITISSVLLLSILVISLKRIQRIDSIQRDILLLWGIATITPLVLWSLSNFFFQRQFPTPKAVSMLIFFNDQFLFLTLLLPVIVAQYITGILLRNKALGRLAVFFALMCIPIIVFMNFRLDENNIQEGAHIGRMLAICFRFVLPLVLAICSWSALKAVQRFDNTPTRLVDHRNNTTNHNKYLIYLGIIWLTWGCIHLAIQLAGIHTIENSYELIDGPLVDGTYELLNICFFSMLAFVFFHKHQRREVDSIHSRHTSSLWTMCFFAVMIHEETASIFIRSIAYDSFHVYFLYLTGASFVAVLPLLTYTSCSILPTSQKTIITLSSLACSFSSFFIPYIIEQPYFHITTNCISLFLPPFTLIAYSIIPLITGKRQKPLQES